MSGVLPERRAEVNGEVEHRGRQSHDSGAHEQCLTLRQQGRGIGGSDARHEEQLNLGEAQVGHNLLIGAVYVELSAEAPNSCGCLEGFQKLHELPFHLGLERVCATSQPNKAAHDINVQQEAEEWHEADQHDKRNDQ